MSLKTSVAAFTTAAFVATSMALMPVEVPVASAQAPITQVGVEAREVTTDLRCSANAPVLGAQDADQPVALTTVSPTSVAPGTNFEVISQTGELAVPTDVGGFGINFMNNIVTRTVFSNDADFVSATLDMSSAYYKPTPSSPEGPLPGAAPSVSYNPANRMLSLTMPGPYVGGSVLQAPRVITTWTSRSNGSVFTSEFGGNIPASTSSFPWADPGFTLNVNANLPDPIGTSNIPTFCAPNYGPRSNIPANLSVSRPFLSRTLSDDQPPTIVFRTPANNLVYDLDSVQEADFECIDPSGVTSCVGTVADGDLLDTSTFGTRTFTVTATDSFGLEREQTITYTIAGNSEPTVDAGADQSVASNTQITLSGSATDPDAGQLVSYLWEQVSGPAVTLSDTDDPFNTVTKFTSPPGPATLVFRLRADDGFSTGNDTVTITVLDNTPPALTNPLNDITINTRTSTVLNATATDAEGYPVSYSWTQVDENGDELASDDPDRVITGQPTTASITVNAPDRNAGSTLRFNIVVSDGDERADFEQTVVVTVRPNRTPAVTAGDDQTVNALTAGSVQLAGASTDADGHAITYAWTQVDSNGDPLDLADPDLVVLSNPTAANPTFTAPQGPKTLYFALAVSDPYETTDALVTVEVAANQAPAFTAGQATQSGRGGGDIAITGAATDADGHTISYQWTQVDSNGDPLAPGDPALVTITNATSATASIDAPFNASPYVLYFRVTASDAFGGTASLVVTLDVLGNRAPVALSPDRNPALGATVNLNGSATDPDGHAITGWEWTQVDSNGDPVDPLDAVTLAPDNVSQNVSFTAAALAGTVYYFELVATDEYGADSDPVTVTVTVGNKAPTVSAGANTTGTAVNQTVTLTGSVTDPDAGDSATYLWEQVDSVGDLVTSGPDLVVITDPTALSTTFVTPTQSTATTLYFRLTATDSAGATGTATRSVGVIANRAPATPVAATALPAQASRTVGTYAQFTATAPTDPDGHPSAGFTYNWIQTSSTGATTDCRGNDSCGANVPELEFLTTGTYTVPGLGSVTATPRQPVVLVPGQWASTSSMFVRYTVGDGFGATSAVSPNLTFSMTNTATSIQWAVRGTGTPATNVAADASPRNPVWGNSVVEIDATQNPAKTLTTSDPDGPITYTLNQYTSSSNTTNCSTGTAGATQCQLGLPGTRVTSQTNTTGKFTFTMEPGRNAYFRLSYAQGGTTSTTTRFTVVSTQTGNTAPVISFGTTPSTVFLSGSPTTITLDGIASDAQTSGGPFNVQLNSAGVGALPNQTLSYEWVQTDAGGTALPGGHPDLVTLSSSTALKPTFTSPDDPKTLHFRFTASDGVTTTSSTRSILFDVNGDPVVQQDKVVNVRPGATATLNPTITDPNAGQTLTYAWEQTDENGDPISPTVTLSSATAAAPTFTAPISATELTLYFEVTVSDGLGGTASGIVTVVVAANAAPVANAGDDQLGVLAGETVNLSASGSTDGDNDTLTYAWTQTGGPAVTLTGGTTATPSFTAPAYADDEVLTFEVTVTDTAPESDTDTVDIEILENQGPVADAPAPITGVKAGETVDLVASATDREGNTITYAWTQVDGSGDPLDISDPTSVTLSSGSAQNPTFDAPGLATTSTLYFRMVPTDSYGENGAAVTTTVSVLANQAPVANAGSNQTSVPAGVNVTLNGSASSDPDGNTITYAWTQTAGPAVTLSDDTAVQPMFVAPATNGAILTFRLIVTDQFGVASTPSFVTIGTKANGKPVADTGGNQTGITTGETVTLDGSGSSDPDGHTIVHLWTQLDPVTGDPILLTDPLRVELSDNPAEAPTFVAPAGGVLWFSLVVTDQYGLSSDVEIVTVEVNPNVAPTADAGPDQPGIVPDTVVELSGSVADVDNPVGNQSLTVLWTQEGGTPVTLTGPAGLEPTFTAPNAAGDLVFRLTVTDGYGGTDFDEVTVSVVGNQKPIANAGPDQSGIAVSDDVQLDGSASADPDDHGVASYQWTQVDVNGDPVVPSTVTLSDDTVVDPTFTVPGVNAAGLYRFSLVVTDGLGLASDPDIVEVATEANAAPTANAGANQTVASLQLVTLLGAFTDPEGHTATYEWTQVNGAGNPIAPTVTLSSNTALQPTFTAPNSTSGTSLRFRLVVTDQFGAVSAPAFVSVSVLGNRAPTAVASANVSIAGREAPVALIGDQSSDPDNHTITYSWTQVDPTTNVPVTSGDPTEATIADPTAANTTFVAPLSVATVKFALVVTDQFGLSSAPAYVTIELVANNAPTANAGAPQVNRAANSTVTLTGSATDPDFGETFTYAWTQTDAAGDPIDPAAPEKVTLNTPNSASTTFTTRTLNNAHTLYFRLLVTDSQSATSNATTTVAVNANRAITGLAAPTVLPTAANVAWRTIGRGVQLTQSTAGTDPDGNPSGGWTYEWVQTDAAGNECAPDCAVATVELKTSGSHPYATSASANTNATATARQPIFTVPPVLVPNATLYFKAKVNDGFGAIATLSVISVPLTNSAPVLVRNNIDVFAGQDFSVERGIHTTSPCPTSGSNCQNLVATNFAANTTVYGGMPVLLDGRTAAFDPDGGPVDVDFNTPTLPVVTAVNIATQAPTASRRTAGACESGTSLSETDTPNVWSFTPTVEQSGFCRIQFRATDAAGSSTTWGTPDACLVILFIITQCTGGQFHAGSASTGDWARGANVSLNTQADFWLNVKQNVGGPNIAIDPLPVRVFNTSTGAGDTVVTLDASDTVDPDTQFAQPLTHQWEQVDTVTGDPLPTGHPDLVQLATPTALVTTFVAPTGGPRFLQFRLTSSDGRVTTTGVSTSMKVTTRRPVPVATATVDGSPVTEVRQDELVNLSGVGSTSPDGRDLTYEWRQVSGPEVELLGRTTIDASFVAPEAPGADPEDIVLELVVRDGFSANYQTVTVETQPVADAPTDLTAVETDASLELTWSAPLEDNGSTTTGFRIEVSTDGGTTWTTNVANTESFDTEGTATGLTNGTPYLVRVRAVGDNGVGRASAPVGPVTPRTVPGLIEDLVATPQNQAITLTWTAPSTGGATISSYVVEQSTEGGAFTPLPSVAGTETSLLVTGLLNGTPYQFRIRAVNVAGDGPTSDATTAVAPRDVPGAPRNVAGIPGIGSVRVNWLAPLDTGGSPVTGYKLERRAGNGAWVTVAANLAATPTSRNVIGLLNGTSYTFRVSAISAGGTGAATVSTPVVAGAPTAPRNLTITPQRGKVNLSWTAPSSSGGLPLTGYRIQQRIGTGAWTTVVAKAPIAPTTAEVAVSTSDTYSFRVIALNLQRASAPSNVVTAEVLAAPITKPGKPTAVVAKAGKKKGSLKVTWKAPAVTGGAPITSYKVEVRKGKGAWTVAKPAAKAKAKPKVTLRKLDSKSKYKVRVSAVNSAGTSKASKPSKGIKTR
jgi:hypothetical protein